MIPKYAVTEWGEFAPWKNEVQIEQDLLICRALVKIYQDDYLSSHLAFRGGTALHKLYLSPQPRYSEDIDLVQVQAEPIKETYDRIREALLFLGEPKIKQKRNNNTLIFRVQSSGVPPLPIHLKVEINCKEHFSVLPLVRIPFEVNSMWFQGRTDLLTYQLDELIGTKLRALYQRRKGRDLYDLFKTVTISNINVDNVMNCYKRYMGFVAEHIPTYKEFVLNVEEKLTDDEFLGDTKNLLRPNEVYNPVQGYELVRSTILDRMREE